MRSTAMSWTAVAPAGPRRANSASKSASVVERELILRSAKFLARGTPHLLCKCAIGTGTIPVRRILQDREVLCLRFAELDRVGDHRLKDGYPAAQFLAGEVDELAVEHRTAFNLG